MPFTLCAIRTLPGLYALTLSSLLAQSPQPNPTPRPAAGMKPAAHFKVMVDAGHGGDDHGAKGPRGLLEKKAALDLAQALGERLETLGFQVGYTRSDDTFIPLWERPKMANEAGADLFISLHLNSARARAAKGSEVYFLALGMADEEADAIAALENASGAGGAFRTIDPVESILEDLAQKAYLHDSETLAVSVQTQLNRMGGIKERGVKQAPFIVLRGAAMPAVLIETAFISNPKEEAKLKDPVFRKKVAEAIATGIRRFFSNGHLPAKRRAVEVATP